MAIASDLQRYLQMSRDRVLSSLDGLPEYDMRRPMTPTGTNLLGVVKHLTGIELAYLGDSAGRPAPVSLPWVDDGSIWGSADMWATADQGSGYLTGLYRVAWRHSDESSARLSLTRRPVSPGGLKTGGRPPSDRCSSALSPRQRSTRGTATSCGSRSTAGQGEITMTSGTTPGGRPTLHGCRRRPTSSSRTGLHAHTADRAPANWGRRAVEQTVG